MRRPHHPAAALCACALAAAAQALAAPTLATQSTPPAVRTETAPLPAPAASTPAAAAPAGATPPRGAAHAGPARNAPTRIGLVLSGGGARGLAHVGVLKELERRRIKVDMIAGTSMGAIIGGLYASGMSAEAIETELLRIDWQRIFAPRVARQDLPLRRKEEDFDLATALELGYADGELLLPTGAVSSRGLETLLRRFTRPVAQVSDFDHLPIPFRAVATDMESGQPVVLSGGDLAMALRASMSVPGVFPATEVDGRVLGDGGLVDNLPVDVARAMGATRVIAVNVGTPLAKRDTLGSALGLTAQMINILTEQNVQRTLATLTPGDVLITPQLGTLTSGDFDATAKLVAHGEQSAQAVAAQLAPMGQAAPAYAQWRAGLPPAGEQPVVLDWVAFEGTQATNPERLAWRMASRPGELFEPANAARDTRQLAATGDYARVDYRLVHNLDGDGLVLDMADKPWGPNYLRLGLRLRTNFRGDSGFDIKLAHNRHWLTPAGTEWRNEVQIGETPMLFSEIYHPLNGPQPGAWGDWFAAGYALAQRQELPLYAPSTAPQGTARRTLMRVGLDLGKPWGPWGELRLGVVSRLSRTEPLVLDRSFGAAPDAALWREVGLRARLVLDQLDYVNFPTDGWRVAAEASAGARLGGDTDRVLRLESDATWAQSWGAHTLNLYGQLRLARAPEEPLVGAYPLGGFLNLSGYEPGQLSGNAAALMRASWYTRLGYTPVFARGFFAGASLELGQAWATLRAVRGDLRLGSSAFIGADTGVGPLYLALTYAPQGDWGLVLFVGRP